jgi:hypothetical protein
MLGTHKLVVDTFCELAPVLEPYADHTFWKFDLQEPVPGSVTVVSRQTLDAHCAVIKQLAEQQFFLPVLVNPTEGSQTIKYQCQRLGLLNLILQGKLLLVGCGDMEPELANLWYDNYMGKPYDYEENLKECTRAKAIFTQLSKPYDFLFLNGRTRAHRKYLIESLRDHRLLERSLWTCLDTSAVPAHVNIYGSLCDRSSEIQLLPSKYEVPHYQSGLKTQYQYRFVKDELFGGEWGEIYLQADAYIDTYFSVVSETVFDYPYSLRSEKIYKPIAIGHPFVAAANRGYYRDLRSAGFRTFDHLIDENFDLIDNNQDRLDRITAVIADLCRQDLDAFIVAAQETCVYNQQHMREQAPQVRAEFVPRFQAFVDNWKKQ